MNYDLNLIFAACGGSTSCVSLLIDAGVDVIASDATN